MAIFNTKEEQERLFHENIGLAVSIANDIFHMHKRRCEAQYVDRQDLVQLAYIGLMRATKYFDIDRGYTFSTYATYSIRGEVYKGIGNKASLIKIPRLSTMLDEDRQDALAILYRNNVNSIDKQISMPDGSKVEYRNFIEVDNGLDAVIDNLSLSEAIRVLTDQERYCVVESYLKSRKQVDIAKDIGVSQVQVSRIIKRALNKMRGELIN